MAHSWVNELITSDQHPAPLQGDPKRQAVPSQAGLVYQAWWSIDAWLKVGSEEVVYLECAEDFDVVKNENGVVGQVRNTIEPISLGNQKAIEAVENFWTLTTKESRAVQYHYITTSGVAKERGNHFAGESGISAWRAAQTNKNIAGMVAAYVASKLSNGSELKSFLESANIDEIQSRLFQRFHWFTDQPDLSAVKRSVDDRITELLSELKQPLRITSHVHKFLESRYWEILIKPNVSERRLVRAELLRIVDDASTVYVPVPIEQIPHLLGSAHRGLGLLQLLISKTPLPPIPLLERAFLVERIDRLINQRRTVLLTGGVFKGKTTLAQLVLSRLGQDSWWISLVERSPVEVDNILLALSREIEDDKSPPIVVLDDLDVSPTAYRTYRDSLALVMHRSIASGRAIIITAQGASSDAFEASSFPNLEVLDVPEIESEESTTLCVSQGCPENLALTWGPLLSLSTAGHPKLLQVRIDELVKQQWPNPSTNDLLTSSAGVRNAKELARRLFSDSTSDSIAEFVYVMSEALIPLHRAIVINVSQHVIGIVNAGDVIDALSGKWLERIDQDYFRVTALLRGEAKVVWPQDRVKQAHASLHSAILKKHHLDHIEAGALLWHAFMSGDEGRIAHASIVLQIAGDHATEKEIYQRILWLTFIALEEGELISKQPDTEATIRFLQYRVASAIESENLSKVLSRWQNAIDLTSRNELRTAMQAALNMSVGIEQSLKIPLSFRLRSIDSSLLATGEIAEILEQGVERAFDGSTKTGMPSQGTTAQMYLICAARCVHGVSALLELIDWLDDHESDQLRLQFEEMIDWPVIQELGSFVQGAWAFEYETTTDWQPWLNALERVRDYSNRRNSPNVGREAAKAVATILVEHMDRGDDALEVLNVAEREFGSSSVLLEQRANVRFQMHDDEEMLRLWNDLCKSGADLDPFAHRRAGISAARLGREQEASNIFLAAANGIDDGVMEVTKFGLQLDAAALADDVRDAASILIDAVIALPESSNADGNARWEAVIRVASETCINIRNRIWGSQNSARILVPGFASNPGLMAMKIEPRQPFRTAITRAQTIHLAASLNVCPITASQAIDDLMGFNASVVRVTAAEAKISLAFASGANKGFIEALCDLDLAEFDFINRGDAVIEDDDGLDKDAVALPERWVGLLIAGAICSEKNILGDIEIWTDDIRRLSGTNSPLEKLIEELKEGVSLPHEMLARTINDSHASTIIRCGAAVRLLNTPVNMETALGLQQFLTFVLMSEPSSKSTQRLYSYFVCIRFADWWLHQATNASFNFISPRDTVPVLITSLKTNYTIGGVLRSVHNALRVKTPDFLSQVI